jgi:ArsR family transcriptional regulator
MLRSTTSADSDDGISLDTLERLAANYLEWVIATFKPGTIIGVAWGTGVHAPVLALPNGVAHNIDVVQLMGGVGALAVDGPDLARIIAEKLGGRHYDLHAPVLVEKASTRDMFMAEPAVRRKNIFKRHLHFLTLSVFSALQTPNTPPCDKCHLSDMTFVTIVFKGLCYHWFSYYIRLSEYDNKWIETMNKPQASELNLMHATLCQAIADPTRIALIYELGEGPKHVNEMVDALDLPQATVSRHLKILRERSLVTTRREGPYVYYELADTRVLEALEIMRTILSDVLTRQQSLAQAISKNQTTTRRFFYDGNDY